MPDVQDRPKIVTNRVKAIVAQNLFAVFQFLYICGTKIACNQKRVNAFDMMLFSNSSMVVVTGFSVVLFGTQLSIDRRYRAALLTRCVVGGAIGLACFSFGAVLIPITLQLTVGNMAPFFAGLFGYLIIGERMSAFEVIAMFVSFGAIVLIAVG